MKHVHLIVKTHLDIGFTDSAAAVFERYRTGFIPRAIELAHRLRDENGKHRFIWTTGAWLIHEYLEKADPREQRLMENAITHGDIAWHALPFTTHSELMDAGLFRFGLSISQELDRRFGRKTIAAKMTDVPGHTRAIVPLLAEAGIEFLHLGVNPASHPPDVPDLFIWEHTDGSRVMVMLDQTGYGGSFVHKETGLALEFLHSGDNQGPPTAEEITAAIDRIQLKYPGANVQASTLDAFAAAIREVKDSLPVVTAEIGDTWIHGVGSDPCKTAAFLEQCRRQNYSKNLLLVAEHTWGRDIKSMQSMPQVWSTYETQAFLKLRAAGKFAPWETSWQEQRDYINAAPYTAPEIHIQTGRRAEVPQAWSALRAKLHYQVFGSADYERFVRQYNPDLSRTAGWAIADFTKPGLEKVLTQGREWEAVLQATEPISNGVRMAFSFPEEAITDFGCPRHFIVEIDGENWQIIWRDKQPCRIPEAIWLDLFPENQTTETLRLVKLGEEISPWNVVDFGARSLHAASEIRGRGFSIRSLDAPLVAVGKPSLLNVDNRLPEINDGVHFNLYNNTWGTNFPAWCGDDARFRFILKS